MDPLKRYLLATLCAGLLGIAYTPKLNAAVLNVSITPSGSSVGSCITNIHTASWFNDSANWGSGSSQIGPGTTVLLCGTFTFSANTAGFIVRGSGTSGSPITIKFDTGTVLQSPYFLWSAPDGNCFGDPCGGAIDVYRKNYITIDGQNSGIVKNTANGSSLSNKQPSVGVFMSGDHLMVKNLKVQTIYNNTSAETSAAPGFMSGDIRIDNQATNVEICNSTLTNAHVGIWSDTGQSSYSNGPTTCTGTQAGTGINYHHNTISDHGWQVSLNGTGYVNVYNSDMSGYANWFYPTPTDQAYHLDGIITFSTAGGVMRPAIYNNYLHGDFVGYPTGFIFCTYGGPGSGSACSIFNNVIVGTSTTATNGQGIYFHSADGNPLGPHTIYNNTFDGFNFTIYADGDNTQVYSVKNNVYVSHGEWYLEGNSSTLSNFTSNNNLYYGGRGTGSPGVGAFSWGAASTYDFAQWRGVGKDANGLEANPNLTADWHLQSGSPAIGLGTNLTSQCTGTLTELCKSKPSTVGAGTSGTGTFRPGSGAWDAGAYQGSSVSSVPSCTVTSGGAPTAASWPGAATTTVKLLQAADHSVSSLASAITSSDTSLPLTSVSTFVANQVVRVDCEEIKVCSGGSALSVCSSGRGFAGTTADSHAANTAVHGPIAAVYHNQLAAEIAALEGDLFGKTNQTVAGPGPATVGASWADHPATTAELLKAADGSTGTLASSITSSDTTLTLNAAGTFVPNQVVGIETELIKICTVSTVTLTVCSGGRGFANTTAAAHNSGTTVSGVIAAIYHNRLANEIIALESDLFNGFGGGTAGTNASWPNHVATPNELLVASSGLVTASYHNRLVSELVSLEGNIFGKSPAAHYTVINWTASTSSNITGYRIYRSMTTGGPYTLLNSTLVPGATYTDYTVVSGNTYYYVATAVNFSNVASSNSNELSAVIP